MSERDTSKPEHIPTPINRGLLELLEMVGETEPVDKADAPQVVAPSAAPVETQREAPTILMHNGDTTSRRSAPYLHNLRLAAGAAAVSVVAFIAGGQFLKNGQDTPERSAVLAEVQPYSAPTQTPAKVIKIDKSDAKSPHRAQHDKQQPKKAKPTKHSAKHPEASSAAVVTSSTIVLAEAAPTTEVKEKDHVSLAKPAATKPQQKPQPPAETGGAEVHIPANTGGAAPNQSGGTAPYGTPAPIVSGPPAKTGAAAAKLLNEKD